MSGIRRVDPPGCGCVDCITGFSVPIDEADAATLAALQAGQLTDAAGDFHVRRSVTVTFEVVRRWDDAVIATAQDRTQLRPGAQVSIVEDAAGCDSCPDRDPDYRMLDTSDRDEVWAWHRCRS